MKESGKRRKRNGSQDDAALLTRSISGEAKRGVSAIFLIALSVFLTLAMLGGAGKVGSFFYEWLSWVFGIGYFLLPLSLLMLAVVILRSFEKHFGIIQIGSLVVFLLASLGLVNLAFAGKGGVLGELISKPIVAGVDVVATVFFLLAFIIASVIIAFDVHLGALFASLRTWVMDREPSAPDEEEPAVTGLVAEPETPEEDDEESDESEMPEEEPQPKTKVAHMEASGNAETEGFPILAVAGEAYEPPPISILAKNKGKPEVGDVKANMNLIKRTMQNFGIQVEMDEASIGPTVTRYSMKPAEGVRLSKIVALQSNLELALAASPIRIEAPIPGKSLVGIEVPNIARTVLGLAPIISDEGYTQSDKPLLMVVGRSINGSPVYADMAKMPHLLVAGTTGAGKSVTIHDFIVSLLYRCGPERLRFIMVDPKRVELTLYNSIPHLLTPVITDAKKAILALKWLAKEMDRRYNILETEKVRDIASYHENVVAPAIAKAERTSEPPEKMPEAMPYIVLIIDELADIMTTYPRELEGGIVKLAQMSRAVGIHLILSTQRPSVKVITGLIKANVPARIALQVASQIDSRTILDMGGAEKLLGAGDTLFLSGEMSKPRRVQAPYISETEVKKVVAYLAKQAEGKLPDEINFSENEGRANDPIFASMAEDGSDEDDELYPDAKRAVMEAGKASTSYLQRKLGIGYARAARLIDILEARGIIGPGEGSKPRTVLAGNSGATDQSESSAENEQSINEET